MKVLYKSRMLLVLGISALAFIGCNESAVSSTSIGEDTLDVASIDSAQYLADMDALAKEFGLPVLHPLNGSNNSEVIPMNSTALAKVTTGIKIAGTSTDRMYHSAYGGRGGLPFDAAMDKAPGEIWRRLAYVTVRAGSRIDALSFRWRNNSGQEFEAGPFGGEGGTEATMTLSDGEYIRLVRIRHGSRIDLITFVTNKKVWVHGYGTGGTVSTIDFGAMGRQCHGFAGRSGSEIDALGFYSYLPSYTRIPM